MFLSNTLAHQNNEKIQNSFAPVHILGSLLNSIHTVNMLAYCSLLNRPECFQTICLNPFEIFVETSVLFFVFKLFCISYSCCFKKEDNKCLCIYSMYQVACPGKLFYGLLAHIDFKAILIHIFQIIQWMEFGLLL